MAGVNKVILLGNLGQDPEIKTLENGTKLANVTIATSENYKDAAGEWQEKTEWHRLTMWRYVAEKAEKLKKGDKVYVEGKLQTRSWEQDGVKKYVTEIIVSDLQFTSKVDSEGSSQQAPQQQQQRQQQQPVQNTQDLQAQSNNPEDDLPF